MNKKLELEILKYVIQDQYVRNLAIKFPKIKELSSEVVYQDSLSKKFVKKVLDEYSWPTISMVGEQGSHNFWLLVQHMDKDSKLQKKAFKLLKKAVSNEEASSEDLAYLKDRILIADGKKQLYGTQFIIKNNTLEMSPTIDIEKLNERRKMMGLPSLKKQIKRLKREYKKLLK